MGSATSIVPAFSTPNLSGSCTFLIEMVAGGSLYIQITTIMEMNAEYSKFKWVFPITLVMLVLLLSLGPYVSPHAFDGIMRFAVYFGIARLTFMSFTSARAFYKSVTVPVRQPTEYQTDVTYAWVIPSYNEEERIINTTLNQLASHPRAKSNYTVFLAMEEHEVDAKSKAENLTQSFRDKFRHIGYTLHRLSDGEAKGKASNVSYCVEHFQEIMPESVDLEKVYVTVMDCDSLAPKEYIDEVNVHIYKNPQRSLKTSFSPVQIFARNNFDVPLLVRSFDSFHSMAHWNSSYIPGVSFSLPLSNYTISYNTLRKIGFWDKHADAIAEDGHTTAKAYFRLNGDYYGETIFTPFNQLNLQSGNRYFDNCRHKFWQSARHAQGLYEFNYTVHKFLLQKVKTFKTWMVLFLSVDSYYFSAIIMPFIGLTAYIQIMTTSFPPSRKDHFEFMHSGIDVIITMANILNIVLHHSFVRYAAARYYGRKNIPFWRVIEYYAFMLFGLWVMMVPSIIVSIIRKVWKHSEYITAPKNHSSDEQHIEQNSEPITT